MKNWKAVVLAAGLMLAVGTGSAFAQELKNPGNEETVTDLVIGAGATATVGASKNEGIGWWNYKDSAPDSDAPTDESTVGNARISGDGKLTVGNDTYTGGLEVGRFIMIGGEVTVGGKVGNADDEKWVNQTSFITGGWQGISADETTSNASVSLTGGKVTLLDGGRIQTVAQGSGVTGDDPRYSQLLHIGGNATVNMNGSSLANAAVLKAAEYAANRPQDDPMSATNGTNQTTGDGWYAKMLIDGTAAINVNNYGVILSRDTTMNGGSINVASGGTLRIQGGAAESVGAGATNFTTGINHSAIKHWGDFNLNNGTIDNLGNIDFSTGNIALNATGGTIKTTTLNLATSTVAGDGNISARNLNVLEGGSLLLDGALAITTGTLSNKGNLTITGATSSTNLLTLDAGSTTNFGGTVNTAGLTAGNNASVILNKAMTSTAAVSMGENSTLDIKETGSLAISSGDLNLKDSTKLKVDSNSDATKTISVDGDLKVTDSKGAAVDAAKYLASQNTSGLASDKTFTIDQTGNIIVTVKEQTDSAAGLANALNSSGSGYMAPGLTTSATDTLMEIAKNKDLTTGQGKVIRDLVSNYLDGSKANSASEVQSVTSALAGLDSAKSLDIAMLTANNVAGRIQSRVADNNLARANADSQFGSGSALASYALNSSFANRFWFGGFGLWEDADRRGFDNGYEYKSGGFITGYDKVFGAVTVGGSFAYTAGSYEDKNALASDSDIDSYAFTLYGTYNHCSGFFGTLMAGYTYSDYDMNNLVVGNQWNKADFHANTWTIGGTLGYDFRPTECLTITPSVGLYHYTSASSTFNTTLQNSMKVEQDATELPIDVAVNYDIPTASGKVRLTANTGYAYSFSKDGGELDGFGYNGIANARVEGIRGRENARHTWNIGAGATYSTGRFDVGVKYDYYLKSDYDAHRIMGTVGISF